MRAAGREGAAGKALADRRRRSRYRRQRSVHRAVYAGRAGEQAARIGMGGRGEQVGGGAMFDDATAVHDGYLVADAGHPAQIDRKSVVYGKCVSVRVDLGGRRIIKK